MSTTSEPAPLFEPCAVPVCVAAAPPKPVYACDPVAEAPVVVLPLPEAVEDMVVDDDDEVELTRLGAWAPHGWFSRQELWQAELPLQLDTH